MRRREFVAALGTAVTWPLVAPAQQPAMPVIGFLRSTPATPFAHLVAAFRQGLNEEGFVEGQNVTVEYRWADNRHDRLPELAADLVRRQVAAIVGNADAVEAARAATDAIPIVFVSGADPVKAGLGASLNRPGANLTGVTFFAGGQLDAKRVDLLHELVPEAAIIAVLLDPNYRGSQDALANVKAAGRVIERQIVIVEAASEREFDGAFAKIVQAGAGALLIAGSPFLTSQRRALVELAARHAIPTIYDQRDHVMVGGLISYAASFTGAYRQAGTYAGRILKGAKPSDLPVLQPTTFELSVNLKTAKALGLRVPPSIMLRADELIE
jgi:putative ABC transport system substrate-binding protein